MKERGMIFNDEMVCAILDGRKTQTRRLVKNIGHDNCLIIRRPTKKRSGVYTHVIDAPGHGLCPYGDVGDRIWVRETYQGPLFDYEHMKAYLEDSSKFEKPEFCVYRADGKPAPEFFDADDNLHCGWRPSIHMPRWASRITLEITDVRVEKLASISNQDAWKEGYPANQNYGGSMDKWLWFRQLWDSIYPEQTFKHNPWVWVIEFKRIDGGTTP